MPCHQAKSSMRECSCQAPAGSQCMHAAPSCSSCCWARPARGKRSLLRALAGQRVDVSAGNNSSSSSNDGRSAKPGPALTAVLRATPAEEARRR